MASFQEGETGHLIYDGVEGDHMAGTACNWTFAAPAGKLINITVNMNMTSPDNGFRAGQEFVRFSSNSSASMVFRKPTSQIWYPIDRNEDPSTAYYAYDGYSYSTVVGGADASVMIWLLNAYVNVNITYQLLGG